MLSRRDLLAGAAGALAPPSYDALLDKVHRFGPEYGSGGVNHAPVVMDVLAANGVSTERLAKWVDRYVTKLKPATRAGKLPPKEYALGHWDQYPAFLAQYASIDDPKAVLARDLRWLARGSTTTMFWQCAIRTAHALRALQREDTKARHTELGQALAWWSARNESSPGSAGGDGKLGIDAALVRVPYLGPGAGLIGKRFSAIVLNVPLLNMFKEFDLHAAKDPLAELVAASARMFANASGKSPLLLHAVTGTAAVRLFQPWVDAAQYEQLIADACTGVVIARMSEKAGLETPPKATLDADALLAKALESDDEHTLELVDACVREFRISGSPELLAAAEKQLG